MFQKVVVLLELENELKSNINSSSNLKFQLEKKMARSQDKLNLININLINKYIYPV